jgi:hypothetical protein
MYLNNRATLIGGIVMIMIALSTLLVVVLTASSQGDNDPSDKAEVAEYLADLADNKDLAYAAGAVGVFTDALLAPIFAALMFILFRDRSAVLATVVLASSLSAAAISATNDVIGMSLVVVATDFVDGGASGVAASDTAVLELGRILAILNFALLTAVFIGFGTALLALGWIVARAPQGTLNPPRWLGWVMIVSGIACWFGWTSFLSEALFVFFPIQLITLLIAFLGIGGWLIVHSRTSPPLVQLVPSEASA